jgi:2-polyprenyl-3-methyl-5-hydroxy-6-metoxy-1,4-benzoquinol methylase
VPWHHFPVYLPGCYTISTAQATIARTERLKLLGQIRTNISMKSAADIYRFTIDPASDTAAANVLRFVGLGKKVLEIGAGPGSISRPLVELGKSRLTAIEIDSKSVEILKGFCDEVIQQDLNDPSWPDRLGDSRFDAIVIADVLEHLYDPWTALRQASHLLNDDGSIVVSIPHSAHAGILGSLLSGDLHYQDWGLLDRTHIRFFAIKNIQDLFEEAGLKIVEFAYVLLSPMETEFAGMWSNLPSRTKLVLEDDEFAHVYQVVVKAKRPSAQPALPGYYLPDHPAPRANKLKFIAFYLPQFHPIPENDTWWGKGFTEWTNASRAEPLYPGHYQPHVPGELGFYDLRLREVQHEQIALAKRFGVEAFCFHYYWFSGHRLLERPLLDFLDDKEANIQFCLNWANENWTRKWDASEHEVLMEQHYSPEGDIEFIKSILPFFADSRYLRVDGRPVLIVYRPQHMPDAPATAERWRVFCRENGVGEIHLVAALTHGNQNFEQFNFDAGVEFPPHNVATPNLNDREPLQDITGLVVGYRDVAMEYLQRDYSARRVYRTVFPSWDNTARVGKRALIVLDGNPENYERWLDGAAHRTVAERPPGDRLVFINAWNEWAEGCHLEPDRRYGMAFLEATKRVKNGQSTIDPVFPDTVLPEPPPPAVPPEPPSSPESRLPTEEEVQFYGYGLRTELRLWGVRKLRPFPVVYRVARTLYRAAIK